MKRYWMGMVFWRWEILKNKRWMFEYYFFLFFIFKLLSQKKLMSITIIIVLVFFIYGVNNVFEKKIFSQEIQKLVLPLLVIVCWSALNLALSSTLKFTLSNLSNRINSISLGFFLLLYISLNYSKRTSKYL